MNLSRYRKDFPITKSYVFLDHANMSPSPVQVAKAVTQVMTEKVLYSHMKFERWLSKVEEARENVGRFLGAQKAGVWFVNSTSDGINIVASGIKWKRGTTWSCPISSSLLSSTRS